MFNFFTNIHIGNKVYFIYTFLTISLISCSSIPTEEERFKLADQLAYEKQWSKFKINTTKFTITGYKPTAFKHDKTIIVYIEGDGFAWRSKRKHSKNPTPLNPIGLKLALQHPSSNVIYLARPCQYADIELEPLCHFRFWTSHRFSKQIITSYTQAVDELKKAHKALKINLIGYSGGAAIAALLATQRDDVTRLVTVAGNLDHKDWTDYLKLSPLYGSLNPADYQKELNNIEQTHFIGANDKISPPELIKRFNQKNIINRSSKTIIVPEQTHYCCWEDIWGKLILRHHLQ